MNKIVDDDLIKAMPFTIQNMSSSKIKNSQKREKFISVKKLQSKKVKADTFYKPITKLF